MRLNGTEKIVIASSSWRICFRARKMRMKATVSDRGQHGDTLGG